jgi:addiction module RelB/DinJ family antitoxin
MAQASPEIRLRIDSNERALFEQVAERVGMNSNDMVRVFIKRSIAAGGFPFDMRTDTRMVVNTPQAVTPSVGSFAVSSSSVSPVSERVLPVHGMPLAYLSEVAAQAAEAAHADHIKAGRLSPSTHPMTER